MKKCFSLLLTLLLALGLTATAWATAEKPVTPAVTVEDVTYEDITEVPIAKLYQLANADTVSPAEEFRFTIEAVSVSDSTETLATMPQFASGTFTVPFAKGEAATGGDTNTAMLTLPTYDTVGIYTYKITEESGDTAGVTYNAQPLYLKVTVLQAEDGMVRVAAVHLGDEDGSKQDHITNTYSAGTLHVTKTVAGHMGDRTRDFHFTVTLTKAANQTMSSDISLTVAGTPQTFSPTWDNNSQCTVSFNLKHGQTASLNNLPYGMRYAVAEDNYSRDGYATTMTDESGVIEAAETTAAFTNTKGGTIDTGVLLDSAPYVVLLLIAAAGGAALLLRRRGQRS